MSQVQEWFNDNPRARPLMMFALLAIFCLTIGIWSTIGSHKPVTRINRTPEAPASQVPTLTGQTGETPTLQPATKGWVSENETPLYDEPGLNRPVLKKLNQWEEVSWLQEQENWDQVRLEDGSQGWLQSKFVQFARPANLDKPNDAELTVMAFYNAVVRKDYAAAYAYLGGAWKSELDFSHFVDGYSRTNSLRTEITQVIPMGENRFQVDVAMKANEMGQEVPYMGSYLIEKTGDEWSLAAGSLTLQGGPRADPRLPMPVPVIETPVEPVTPDAGTFPEDPAPSVPEDPPTP